MKKINSERKIKKLNFCSNCGQKLVSVEFGRRECLQCGQIVDSQGTILFSGRKEIISSIY